MTDRRLHSRKRVLKGAMISYSNGNMSLPCVVRDLSDTGARIQLHPDQRIPDKFKLIVELDGMEVDGMVVWRNGEQAAINFESQPRFLSPKRLQVVSNFAEEAEPRTKLLNAAHRNTVASESADNDEAGSTELITQTDPHTGHLPILIAEDDPDDRYLIESAFGESKFNHMIDFVENGEELLQYMNAEGDYSSRNLPSLILLDLNMPKIDGRTAMMQLKADRAFRKIPIIVLTTSTAEEDIQRSYDLGVSAYIPKPSSHEELVDLISVMNSYWSTFALLPNSPAGTN